MTENPRGAMFRVIVPNQHSRVTYAELFFDLVFVYAVTQISHMLLGRFTPLGASRSRCCSSRSGGPGSTPPGSPTGSIPN
jgi:hypothetical protein